MNILDSIAHLEDSNPASLPDPPAPPIFDQTDNEASQTSPYETHEHMTEAEKQAAGKVSERSPLANLQCIVYCI